MLNFYHTVNPPQNLQNLASEMHKSSLPIAPVCPIQRTNSTQKQPKNLFDTLLNMLTGARSKWSQPVLKSQPHATLPDRFYVTEVSASKSSPSDMLILQLNSMKRLCYVRQDSRTQRIDRTV